MNRLQSLFRTDEIDPESRNRFLLFAGIAAVVVVSLVLIAFGYYVDRVVPRGDAVIVVGEREFSYAYVQDRVEAAFKEGTFDVTNPAFSIAVIVSNIQNEELTRLIAMEEGVTATEEELDVALRENLGLTPDVPRDTLAFFLRERLQEVDLSLDRYMDIVEANLLEDKLTDLFSTDIPSELEQAQTSVIQVETDAQAVAARQRIVDGEDFGEVAMEVSQHSSAAQGGELGWILRDLLQEDLRDAAFSLEANTLSDIVETERGFYVIKVDGKEVRPLAEEQAVNLGRTYFSERLDEADAKYMPENLMTIGQAQDIVASLGG